MQNSLPRQLAAGLIIALLSLPTHASTPDSARARQYNPRRATQFILPAALITAGAAGIQSSLCPNSPDRKVDQALDCWRGECSFHPEDYLQYLPLAATFGLSLAGIPARNGYGERIAAAATSYLVVAATVNTLKALTHEERPDGRGRNSFPSGHTATVFAGAELVRQEYKDASPWYGAGAYAVATLTGVLRLYHRRHWLSDVLAGAGIGILSTRIAYLLLPWEEKVFFRKQKKGGGNCLLLPYYEQSAYALGLSFS